MQIDNKFNLGQIVYFHTDPEQKKYIVVGLIFRENSIRYEVSHIGDTQWVSGYELTDEEDIVFKISQN